MSEKGLSQKIKEWQRDYYSLFRLVTFLLIIAVAGFLVAITVFLVTGWQEGVFALGSCFSSACVKNAVEYYSGALLIFKETLNLLVMVATIGGIIVALLSYLNTSGATALSNHISHFSVFQSYIVNEISKRDRISPASVDTLFWYNVIFSNSRSGRTTISPSYIDAVNQLNGEIIFSNNQATSVANGTFRYKPHQERVIQALQAFGIKLTHQPRNDFYEIEMQVFSLIMCVNSSFCYEDQVPALNTRQYI